MKRILILSILIISLVSISCTREEPQFVKNMRVELVLPSVFKPEVKYANQEIVFTSSVTTYRFTTNSMGVVEIPEIIPDEYTINTSWELTGKQYKELISGEELIEDKAKVLVSSTLTNVPVFSAEDIRMELERVVLKSLLISKVYYSGTKDNSNRNYTADSFIEIYNNSDEVVYVDGKYLAVAESMSPVPAYPAKDNPGYIYARQICKFPGNGTDFPILPGESIVIAARSARDHRASASTSVDLSNADFEVKDSDGIGNPDVKALPMHSSSTALKFLNLLSGGSNSIFIFETDENVLDWPEYYAPGKSSGERFRRVPVETVIDGVEALKNSAGTGPDITLKRLHDIVDAGFTTITATSGYVNESLERKVSRIEDGRYILQDTNNSIEDFVIINGPTPRKYDHPQLLKIR